MLTAAHCFELRSQVVEPAATALGSFFVVKSDGSRVRYPFHRERADATVVNVSSTCPSSSSMFVKVGDAVRHRDGIMSRRMESEAGTLSF